MIALSQVEVIFGLFLVWLSLRAFTQPRAGNPAVQWDHSFEGMAITTDRFFGEFQSRLQAGLAVREVPLDNLAFGPRGLFESRSLLAERQTYLEVRYKDCKLFVYAAETPTGFYVSEWLYSKYLSWQNFPVLSLFSRWYFNWQTLFQHDATMLFASTMHELVMQVLDSQIEGQKLPPLEDIERKPVLHAFYAGAPISVNTPRRKPLPI